MTHHLHENINSIHHKYKYRVSQYTIDPCDC